MDLSQRKQAMREQLLKVRSELGTAEYREKSDQIITRLKTEAEFKSAEVIHCYVSMNERREVNTHGLLENLVNSKKKPVVSITHFDDGTLSHRYLESMDDLKENKWGVLEPVRGEVAALDEFELVIVPMVGGDRKKNRIGYGKGFYDRFLREVSCPAIGLLFDRCLVESVPVESFDVALDKCITESKIIS
ncbi:5-formyltetrahydrofolate cyclo-ligase [Balneolaceae bacterium YR4-1]|uniref:5-formyltetrahydrofolate cyclo-ligase n=1 Tax=Halalkalibaculum roseum TaxID=2709311 RepID=A0A6M1T2G5_9BACT|nr:5-formyltetrahydrofolate cyclo-ligase [Halalkalibaculum roseum]NGP76215.1 5-formyltetrahydrofolate cyclo-ligase [Halalkalibaculum roseum]